MKKGLIIGFLAGAAVGGVAGYFIADRMVDEKYQKLANEDIEEMRKHFEEKLKAAAPEEEEEQEEPKVIVKDAAAKSGADRSQDDGQV